MPDQLLRPRFRIAELRKVPHTDDAVFTASGYSLTVHADRDSNNCLIISNLAHSPALNVQDSYNAMNGLVAFDIGAGRNNDRRFRVTAVSNAIHIAVFAPKLSAGPLARDRALLHIKDAD